MLEADKIAYTFSGQGSQRVGIWDDLRASAAAREIFQMTDEIVGFPLSKLCSEGPSEELTRTSNAQPAIIAHSLAALASIEELHSELLEAKPLFCLGHSVGEYSALVAARVITIREAIYLIRQRGLLIEQFGGEGKMAALLGFRDQEQVMEICGRTQTEAANFNGPSQIVISGGVKEIEHAIGLAGEEGIKSILLETSHPFHSSLMRPARDEFEKALSPITFKDPVVPIVLNTTARASTSGAEIKAAIARQIAEPVRWHESIIWVQQQGVRVFLEFGPKPVLTGLLRRIYPQAKGICVKDYKSAQELNFN